jgi:CheY-like chemotaxis protein
MAAAKTVLVVDDEMDIRSVVEMMLTDAGYEVTTAEDGAEALRVVDQTLPAVILLDMRMPVMDGWEFARRFRERYNHSAPIIVMTAAENAEARAAEVDAEDYIGKPFDLRGLVRVVNRYANGAPPSAESGT